MERKSIVKKISMYCLVLVSFFLLYPLTAQAMFGGKVDSYSADSVQIASDGKIVSESKYYITPEAMRIDGFPGAKHPQMEDMDLSMLILVKQNKQYFYNHDKKLVYESTVDEKDLKAGYKNLGDVQSEKVVGKEKVSGYKCTKKEVVTNYNVMGMTTKSKVIVWESERFEMPLKVQDEKGGMQEMRNINPGSPAKKHFVPLEGYKQVSNMMAVMGMDFFNRMDVEEEETNASADVAGEDNRQNTTVSNKTVEEEAPSQFSEVNQENVEKAIQSLGNKLKNFKFGN